jgi:hypothetical protein
VFVRGDSAEFGESCFSPVYACGDNGKDAKKQGNSKFWFSTAEGCQPPAINARDPARFPCADLKQRVAPPQKRRPAESVTGSKRLHANAEGRSDDLDCNTAGEQQVKRARVLRCSQNDLISGSLPLFSVRWVFTSLR